MRATVTREDIVCQYILIVARAVGQLCSWSGKHAQVPCRKAALPPNGGSPERVRSHSFLLWATKGQVRRELSDPNEHSVKICR